MNSLDIHTFIGVYNNPVNSRMLSKKYYSAGGDYIRLTFRGTWDEYAKFSRRVYLHVLPAMKIIRRDGDEIEHFFMKKEKTSTGY
ncbi:hypothetical protein K0V28_004421 [Salmonella enterica]|nr:hypothetical protein [Salmonella enterica]